METWVRKAAVSCSRVRANLCCAELSLIDSDTSPERKARVSAGGSVAIFVCLLLCIRLVGGFNGNKDKTLCWSAVSAASEGVGCHCMCTGDMQLNLYEVGDDWEGCTSEYRIRWCLAPIPRRRSLTRGNDISEEPIMQR